ncbi:MAG: hypothetical protein AAB800_04115, partial [Patescibacteria group bacterium]
KCFYFILETCLSLRGTGQHDGIDGHIKNIAHSNEPPAQKKLTRAFIGDLAQLVISANLLHADGEHHRQVALEAVNRYLSDDQQLS